jgi:hypothetical protein
MTAIVDTRELVDAVIEHLTDSYIFPDRAAEAARLLRTRVEEGGTQAGGLSCTAREDGVAVMLAGTSWQNWRGWMGIEPTQDASAAPRKRF